MEYIFLKGTDIKVSRLCIGGCPMGGYGWGSVSRRELHDAVHLSLDKGLNFFDTADIYGLGEAEKLLGEALTNRRHQAVINAKFGVRRSDVGETYYDNSPFWIEEALEASLNRLKTDYVDVYQVHYRDGKTPLLAIAETLERMRQSGKIRCYGLSNISKEDRAELEKIAQHFCSFQNEYSLAKRIYEQDILSLSSDFLMTPMTWGSLGQGILTGKYGAEIKFGSDDRRSRVIYENFYGKKLSHNLKIVERLRSIANDHRVSVGSVAIRWILDRIPESVAIVGVKKTHQVKANLEAMGWALSSSEINELDFISKPDCNLYR